MFADARITYYKCTLIYWIFVEADVINTCSEVEVAKWRLLNLLSSKYNHTSDIHLFLASALNKVNKHLNRTVGPMIIGIIVSSIFYYFPYTC